jgi:hypothetical protein
MGISTNGCSTTFRERGASVLEISNWKLCARNWDDSRIRSSPQESGYSHPQALVYEAVERLKFSSVKEYGTEYSMEAMIRVLELSRNRAHAWLRCSVGICERVSRQTRQTGGKQRVVGRFRTQDICRGEVHVAKMMRSLSPRRLSTLFVVVVPEGGSFCALTVGVNTSTEFRKGPILHSREVICFDDIGL